MNTPEMFEDFFGRAHWAISSYMWDAAQFQCPELFSALLWGELRSAWARFVSIPRPTVSWEERHLPLARLSPCGTFSLAKSRCMAVSHLGSVCGRVTIIPWMLRREHAALWTFPIPFPHDPTSEISDISVFCASHTLLFFFTSLLFHSLISVLLGVPNRCSDTDRNYGI